jgi:tripartite-type tricarboxylate transporter receptor subunit TctC
LFMGPGVPRERVEAFRAAYNATLKDPDFVDLAQRSQLDIDPISADEIATVVRGIYALPESAIERARDFLPAQ